MNSTTSENGTYDVVVIGGALSGGATATLLLRQNPGIRVLILEKSAKLSRRVGEATVEVSAYFMCRVLGMTQYLNESHLNKQGLRFWFTNDEVKTLADASELGPLYQVRVPSYQLDRAAFDEEVLRRAGVAGAHIMRPVTVTDVQLSSGKEQTVTFRNGDGTKTVRSRWIVDASGVAALLARKGGWWKSNTEHPTAAAWSRWKGVKDWDSRELAEKYPQWASAVYGTRGTATNHVIGDGWWSWWIPLKGGDVSVGVVFDQRLVDWPQDGEKIGDRLKTFLMKHPVAREILIDAEFDEKDVHWRKNLAYYSTTFAGDGFVLVGDAAAFMDPFYSPGMDWISFTTSRAAALIGAQRKGEPMNDLIDRHNRDFARSHRCWFEAVYKDKYEYMGEFDLMSTAFIFDLGLYYLGVASQPFRSGEKALLVPPFSQTGVGPIFRFMRAYNRRFAEIARRRRKRRMLGKTNRAQRCLIPGFTLKSSNPKLFAQGFAKWARIELGELLAPSRS
ncbi:MAG TPA: NAD(P)/FAD-dependent oxidoreductase [Chthoniobacterales bacterium]|jgi:flavin-dependent dehydrogenase|nr:NAD(P)/FAD-dependent oxidoreductase [Chthoniobacterales bacterium]